MPIHRIHKFSCPLRTQFAGAQSSIFAVFTVIFLYSLRILAKVGLPNIRKTCPQKTRSWTRPHVQPHQTPAFDKATWTFANRNPVKRAMPGCDVEVTKCWLVMCHCVGRLVVLVKFYNFTIFWKNDLEKATDWHIIHWYHYTSLMSLLVGFDRNIYQLVCQSNPEWEYLSLNRHQWAGTMVFFLANMGIGFPRKTINGRNWSLEQKFNEVDVYFFWINHSIPTWFWVSRCQYTYGTSKKNW